MRVKTQLSKCELSEPSSNTYQFCDAKTYGEDANLVTDLLTSTVHIEIGSFHMEMALTNLIRNAIEASKRGKSVIECVDTGRNSVTLWVVDQGSEIDKDTLRNIFTPCYTKNKEGTGFLTHICKKIIEAHRGENICPL